MKGSLAEMALDLQPHLEWADLRDDYVSGVLTYHCPLCGSNKRDGHKEGCRLATFFHLAELAKRTTGEA